MGSTIAVIPRRKQNSKSEWVPWHGHALDILAAVALIYGAEVLAGFVGAPGIASVRSAMSKGGD
jgi:hypothetical protein